MEKRTSRLSLVFFGMAMALLAATPSLATSFTVHGYTLGERISLTNGTRVWTAQLDVSLEGIASHVDAFCVDLDNMIAPGQYTAAQVLDAFSSPSPAGETPRNLAWAGFVMQNFGEVDGLAVGGITKTQAITGLQAAIWEGIYGGGRVDVSSLSANARSIFEKIMAHANDPLVGDGPLVVDLRGYQDQIIRGGHAVPEPTAALVFGLGTAVVAVGTRRRTV
ncbi:MAG: hypothetical protein R3F35_05530 [Myxococcota bacterium]